MATLHRLLTILVENIKKWSGGSLLATSIIKQAQANLKTLEAERDELLKLVDKLPKCWTLRDNVLVLDGPVLIGHTKLWYLNPYLDEIDYYGVCFCITVGVKLGQPHAMAGSSGYKPLSECYDSREAAEMALKLRQEEYKREYQAIYK